MIERLSNSTMIDVRDLPKMLQEAACTLDTLPEECRGVPEFLSQAKVEILKALQIQIVETSTETVTTETLQKFLTAVAERLGDMKVLCEGNAKCSLDEF